MRTALLLPAVLLLVACGGGQTRAEIDGRRTFEPARILVEPDGDALLIGIAGFVGEGSECGGEQKETAEFVAARLRPSGEVADVSTLPQTAVEWCAEAVHEAVLLPRGGFAIGGSIRGLPEDEGSGDRDFVAARFAGPGEPTQVEHVRYPTTQLAGWLLDREPPPLDREPPELRGLARLPDGRLAVGKYQDGGPNYTLFEVGKRGQRLGRTLVRTKTETVVLSVEANRQGIYVLTEEFPAVDDTDYRYGLYRHRLRGPLARRVEVDPGRSELEVATDFALQDGKVVVVGELDRGKSRLLYVMRRTASGTLDRTWGRGGVVLQPLGPLAPDDNLFRDSRAAVGVLPNRKILVVASIRGRAPKILRFDAHGRLDETFGKKGILTLPPL